MHSKSLDSGRTTIGVGSSLLLSRSDRPVQAAWEDVGNEHKDPLCAVWRGFNRRLAAYRQDPANFAAGLNCLSVVVLYEIRVTAIGKHG